MDISIVCRLCRSRLEKKFRDIFNTPNLLDKILYFTDIEINREENLPKKICHLCYVKLEEMDKFRRRVNETDKDIRKYGHLTSQCTRSNSFKEESEKLVSSSSFDSISGDDVIEDNLANEICKSSFVSDWLSQFENGNSEISVTDPLNLLKVKSIEPLQNAFYRSSRTCSEVDSSSSSKLILKKRKKNSMRILRSDSSITDAEFNREIENDNFYEGENNIGKKMSTEVGQIIVKCPICDKICANFHGVKIHLSRVHRSSKCKLCGASTPTKQKFNYHMQFHISSPQIKETQNLVQCNICKNIFKNKAGLSIHVRAHSVSVPAVCTKKNLFVGEIYDRY